MAYYHYPVSLFKREVDDTNDRHDNPMHEVEVDDSYSSKENRPASTTTTPTRRIRLTDGAARASPQLQDKTNRGSPSQPSINKIHSRVPLLQRYHSSPAASAPAEADVAPAETPTKKTNSFLSLRYGKANGGAAAQPATPPTRTTSAPPPPSSSPSPASAAAYSNPQRTNDTVRTPARSPAEAKKAVATFSHASVAAAETTNETGRPRAPPQSRWNSSPSTAATTTISSNNSTNHNRGKGPAAAAPQMQLLTSSSSSRDATHKNTSVHKSLETDSTSSHFTSAHEDGSCCSDRRCMHSRESIAEFIAMQQEVRRCYTLLASYEAAAETASAQLEEKQQERADEAARFQSQLAALQAQFATEMADVEREKAYWQARAHRAATEAPAHNGPPPQPQQEPADESAVATLTQELAETQQALRRATQEAEAALREVGRLTLQLEQRQEEQRVHEMTHAEVCRAAQEDRVRLSRQVQLWKTRARQLQQQQQLEEPSQTPSDESLGEEKPTPEGTSPTPRPEKPPAYIMQQQEQQQQQQQQEQHHREHSTPEGKKNRFAVPDSTPRRQERTRGASPAASPHTATTTVREEGEEEEEMQTRVLWLENKLDLSERKCRELLRALLDKERQVAEVAAERTYYRQRCGSAHPTPARQAKMTGSPGAATEA